MNRRELFRLLGGVVATGAALGAVGTAEAETATIDMATVRDQFPFPVGYLQAFAAIDPNYHGNPEWAPAVVRYRIYAGNNVWLDCDGTWHSADVWPELAQHCARLNGVNYGDRGFAVPNLNNWTSGWSAANPHTHSFTTATLPPHNHPPSFRV